MHKIYSYILLVLMLLPLVIIPKPATAVRVTVGVSVKAGTYNFYDTEPTTDNVLITDNGILRIIINRTEASELGDYVRVSFLENTTLDIFNPDAGGYFLNVSNINVYAPSDPAQKPYGGVIDITRNSTLSNGTAIVGNVTVLAGGSEVIIKVDLSKLPSLANVVYITDTTDEEYDYRNLYNKWLRVKVYDAGSWDAVISANVFKIIYIPVSCNDVIINVYNAPVIHYQDTTIQVSFERFFDKVLAITGVQLNVSQNNKTTITMINKYNTSEQLLLVNFTNGVLTTNGTPAFLPWSVEYNASTINFTGWIADYAPYSVDPNEPYVSALYLFDAYFKHEIVNETVNLTFTIHCSSETAATLTTPYLRINATLEVTTTDIAGDPTETNPGDIVNFTAYNVPKDYLSSVDCGASMFNLTYGSTIFSIDVSSFITLICNMTTGIINGSFTLPDKPYGGSPFTTYLVFNDGKWIRDGILYISPYFETFIVTNETLRAVDHGSEFEGLFVKADFAAPGDYLYVKGYGYNITNTSYLIARLDSTILLPWALAVFNDTGKFYAVFRIANMSLYPVAPGSYTLWIGFIDRPGDDYSKLFTVVRNDTVRKLIFFDNLINIIRWNNTDYSLFHKKLGEPYTTVFDVEYPLVNDTFQTTTWPTHDYIEIIGFTEDYVNLTFYSLTWNIHYQFLNITLTHGYARVLLEGKTIPFIPYGNYTLRLGNETITGSIDDRRIFKVYMGIDVDVSECRNGTLTVNIVGGAPSTTMTLNFTYRVNETTNNYSPTGTPWWNGVLSVNVTTNIYGTGSTTIPLTTVYPDDYVVNATLDTLIYLGIRLSEIENIGNTTFLFVYNATLDTIDDNLGTGITYELGPSDTEINFAFHVFAKYNFTLTIDVTYILYRAYFVISVPETVLPGDKITVQIFPHVTDIWDLVVEPAWLFDVDPSLITKIIWYLDIRLVDPVTNSIVNRVEGYYAGSLQYMDLDDDGDYEFWFVAELTAPFLLGNDKTYRVDTKLMFALATTNTTVITTGISSNDGGCHNNVTVNGTIYFSGYGTYIMLGGDHQIVTVLGVLEAKLDRIYNGIVELNATVNDMYTYLKVNITEFLNAINNTVVEIKEDTAELLVGQARIEANLSTLLSLTTEINNTVTMIFVCCGELSSKLDRIEATLNETKTYVLWINGNVTSLITKIDLEVIPKFTELYNNLTVEINASRDLILYKLSEVNSTIINYVLAINNTVTDVRNILVSQVIPLLNWYYGNLSIKISDVNASILAELHNVNTSLTLKIDAVYLDLNNTLTTILYKLEEYYNNLDTKLSNIYNNLTLKIDNSTTTLLNKIDAVNRSITLFINTSTNRICSKLSTLQSLIETRFNDTFNLIKDMNASLTAFINDTKVELLAKIDAVNTTLSTLVIDKTNMLHDLILEATINMTSMMNEYYTNLSQKLSDMYSNLTLKIDNSTTTLLNKIEAVNQSIILFVNMSTNRICNRLSMLQSLIEQRFNTTFNMIKNMNSTIIAKIDDSTTTLLVKLDNVNATLFTKVEAEANMTRELMTTLITNLNQTIMNRLDEMEGTILVVMAAYEQKLEGLIEETADDIIYNITLTIDNDYNALKDLINIRADQILFKINESTTTIITRINNLEVTLTGKLDDIETLINDAKADIMTELGNIETSMQTYYNSLKNIIETSTVDIKMNITGNINNAVDELSTLALDINKTVTLLIKGKASELTALVNKLKTDLSTALNTTGTKIIDEIKSAHDSLTGKLNDLSNKIDSQTTTLKNELSNVANQLSDKLDTLSKAQKDSTDKINGNVSIFGSATLLLLVIVIGLVGYNIISGRRAPG